VISIPMTGIILKYIKYILVHCANNDILDIK
jgi:hypothetical protein